MNRIHASTRLFGIILAALVLTNIVVTHNVFTAPFPGHNDFMSRWEGTRSYIIDGLNPYGEQASLNIQGRIYGRAAAENEDPGYFAYPFYTVFVVAPLVATDYAWASAIWMVLLEGCLIGALILNLAILKWRPTPILLTVVLLWAIFDYFAMRGLLLGQPGIVVYALEMLAIWALLRRHDALGGVALALSTIKPQMGFLIVPFLLLAALREQRWRYVGSFTLTFGVLMGASFILLPTWLSDWLGQVGNYSSYTAIGSPVWVVTQYYLGLGSTGELIVISILVAYMLIAWFSILIRRHPERLLWVSMLTLTITHLIAVRTATTHFVVFTLPILFYIHAWSKTRFGWSALFIPIALIILTWVHFLTSVQGEFEDPSLYLPLPFTILFLLIVTRRRWWKA